MRKNIILSIIIAISFVPVVAQTLQISDPIVISNGQDGRACISPYGEGDACITFVVPANVELSFKSNVDSIKITKNEVIGSLREYILVFNTDDHFFNLDRKLKISSKESPQPLEIEPILSHKRSLRYVISLIPCYKPLMDNGNELFERGKYEDAKVKFLQAKACYDSPQESFYYKKLVFTDSILIWQKNAEESIKLLDFAKAIVYYKKILKDNENDVINRQKLRDAEYKNVEFCNKYFKQAEKYYYYHEYEKALALFENVTKIGCYYQDSASYMIQKVEKALAARKDKRGVFTYEFGFNTFKKPDLLLPIGFQIGSYNTKKAGFYWSLFANSQIFNSMRKNYPKSIKGNFGSTIGITFRPIPAKHDKIPIWLHLGAGYSLMSNFRYKNATGNEVNYNGETLTDEMLKFKPYHAVPFEAGVTIKIWYFVVRYTFQYRLWFVADKDVRSTLDPYIHKFGIGFCW